MGEVDVTIPGKIKLGIIHPANAKIHGNGNSSKHKVCPSAVPVHSLAVHSSTVQTDPGVHVLDYSPENKLTLDQRNERIKFLKDQLKLGESVLNPKEQDEVINIYLQHFDACSVPRIYSFISRCSQEASQ